MTGKKALGDVLGHPDWSIEARFQTVEGRKEHEDDLDSYIENWTVRQTAEEVADILQSAGVPAGIVQTPADLFADPQLKYREHFIPLDHPEMGIYHIASSPFSLSGCRNKPKSAAPLFGEHNEMVLKDLLGMDDEQISDLVISGALE